MRPVEAIEFYVVVLALSVVLMWPDVAHNVGAMLAGFSSAGMCIQVARWWKASSPPPRSP